MKVDIDGTSGQLMAPAAQFLVHNFSSGDDEAYFLHEIAGLTLSEVRLWPTRGWRPAWHLAVQGVSRPQSRSTPR